jgi:succinate dehydrogenase hydrophobic anchor subunit
MEINKMSARTVQPGFSFEYIMWIFTRISGLALLLLGAVGMVSAFTLGARTQVDLPTLMRWTFFPNPNHVINSEIPDITLGWANAFWQVMQILIAFFGATHAYNGLRVVLEDFIGQSYFKPFLRGVIFLLWGFSLIIAVYVILFS